MDRSSGAKPPAARRVRVKSLLTNVNKKMVFFNEGFPKGKLKSIYCLLLWDENQTVNCIFALMKSALTANKIFGDCEQSG